MLSPLPRLRPGTIIAEPVTTATTTTATTAFDSRTSHRMRTRNIARRGTCIPCLRLNGLLRTRAPALLHAGAYGLLQGARHAERAGCPLLTRRIAATGVGMLSRTRLLATLERVATIATVITTLRTIRPATPLGGACA